MGNPFEQLEEEVGGERRGDGFVGCDMGRVFYVAKFSGLDWNDWMHRVGESFEVGDTEWTPHDLTEDGCARFHGHPLVVA